MSPERRLGTIIGPVVLRDEHGAHDLRISAWTGPEDGAPDAVSVVEHDAACMMLIEKRGIFQRLLQEEFPARNRCLLMTGQGYPGRTFRQVVKRLHEELQLPLHVMADNDPAGYEFFFLIARGTSRTAGPAKADSAIPDADFVGLRVRDFDSLGLGEGATITLSKAERLQLLRLRSCPWLRRDAGWQTELDALLQRGFKVEMEALYSISPALISASYLPDRLAAADHLRLSTMK